MKHPLFQENWHGRRVVLLQGPVGPFFWRAAKWLRAQGATVRKLNFNGGDVAFFPTGRLFTRRADKLQGALRSLLEAHGITDVWLFGDCRPIHRVAIELAKALGVAVWVFEEGYFRPAFITCERGGVNGHSALPTVATAYADWPLGDGEPGLLPARPGTFRAMAVQACTYWLMAALLWPLTPFYRHHRSLNVPAEAGRWLRGYARKLYFLSRERGLQELLVGPFSGKFVLVPLQVHNDAQVTVHSGYADVREFIVQTLEAFAQHAPQDHVLAFKHHPLDRAYREYGRWIRKQAAGLGLADRVYVLHDQHLPTLLDHAAGAVVINSTVGLSAIHQGVATHVMGKAFYGFAGLTHQGSLSDFLASPAAHKPDAELYRRFRAAVISTTQINDNFYKPIRGFAVARAPQGGPAPSRLSV
ncbi:capsule biosynthesis protein [Acidovorax sp. M2(2025)]|uniref:capsule biosynthesis protein n=1 Tax=Acidovorax sp. M2(2025) TaxID=3411355 RepID=UPI003BF4C450